MAFFGNSAAGAFIVGLRRPSSTLASHQGLYFVTKSTDISATWSASVATRYVISDTDLSYAMGSAGGRPQRNRCMNPLFTRAGAGTTLEG